MINSGALDGLSKTNAIKRIIEQLEAAGTGRAAKTYRLRDWLISRQRFWGTPDPDHPRRRRRAHAGAGGPAAASLLPLDRGPRPAAEGRSRRSRAATDWVNVPDPRDG